VWKSKLDIHERSSITLTVQNRIVCGCVCVQIYSRDASNPVRQASQLASNLHNVGADLGGLSRRLTAYTSRHELHAASRQHAVAVHPLQPRLHHLLVDDVIRGRAIAGIDDVILRAVRAHDFAVLAHVPRHQRASQQDGGRRPETEVDRGDDDRKRRCASARCRGGRRRR